MNVIDVWDKTLELIKPEVPDLTFNTWFKDAKPLSIDETSITLAVTNDLVLSMLKRHIPLIQNAIFSFLNERYENNCDFCLKQKDGAIWVYEKNHDEPLCWVWNL